MIQFPDAFINSLRTVSSCDVERLLAGLQEPAPVSIRVNDRKFGEQLSKEPVPWTSNGYYLEKRPVFTLDPLFHSGVYYVQEASSMLLQHAFRQLVPDRGNLRVLDACAAPGGKSTLVASLLDDDSLLVSNEFNRLRASILKENCIKWGVPNIMVTCSDTVHFSKLEQFFDAIIIDAPCSGEGMFRKLDYALDEWSPQNVDTCVTRQKEILANVWSSLKDGGLAFYSTCTFNTKENEAVARWAIDNLDAQSISLSIDPSWGVLEQREDDVWSYRCFPGTCRGEGFSLCILRKNDRMSRLPRRREKQGKLLFEEIKQKDTHQVSNWVTSPETVFARDITNGIYAFNPRLYPDVLLLSAVVKTIHAGCLLAEQKGKDFVPFPGLPFSTICNHSAFNSVELDAYVALTYFSKNTFEIGSSADGWVLLKYKNHGMGIVKKIATRLNNPYPHEWKIKMQFSPTECASVL